MAWPKRTAGQKPGLDPKSMHSEEFAGSAEGHFELQTGMVKHLKCLSSSWASEKHSNEVSMMKTSGETTA